MKVEQFFLMVVVVVVLMEHLLVLLVDQVVVALTTNQEQLESQTKDLLVQTHTPMLTRVVVEQVVLLKNDPLPPRS